MYVVHLPHHVLYNIWKYLSFIDIINLSKTCKQLYMSINEDNCFWMTLIQNHFGSDLYQRYVNEIFQNKKNSDYVFYPGRSLRTPYTVAYGRLRRRIRPYTCYLRSVYDRISPYYMIQYYGRISPWPYTEKYGDRIRNVYARKRPSFFRIRS